MNSISPELNLMIKACEKASKSIIRDFGEIEKLQVSIKGPHDFVSNADIKAEKIIIEELSKSKKKYSFLSEEIGFLEKEKKEIIWIIDPIDGTLNFLHGIPHFAISIGLKVEEDIVAGIIYDPIKDEMFYAEKNNGAFLNNKRIRVSKKKSLNECLFATGGKNQSIDISTRKTGSAALDLAYVACGRFDGYFQNNLNLWDLAAGIILVKESGGIVNQTNPKKDLFNIKAANNEIYDKMLEKLKNF